MTEKEQLIEAWTRNLEDNAEHQFYAIGLLTEEIDDNAASIPVVSAMLQKVSPQSRKKRHLIIWCLVIMAVLLSLTHIMLPLQLRSVAKTINSMSFGDTENNRKIGGISPNEALLLYGNPKRIGKAQQMRALWESDPKNPAYFADYSIHYISEHRTLPPDFLKIAAEIDPDNAWFTCVAASMKAKGVCLKGTEHPRSPMKQASLAKLPYEEKRSMSRNVIYAYSILDPTAAQEALDLWRQSLKQSKYDSYEIAMHQKRYPLLKKRSSFLNQMPPIIYIFSHPTFFRSRDMALLLAASLQQENLQSNEGKQLMRDIDTQTERLLRAEPVTLVDALILRAYLRTIYSQIHVMDHNALEPERTATWKNRMVAMDARDQVLQEKRNQTLYEAYLKRHGSVLTSLTLPTISLQAATPAVIPIEHLAPLRYVDLSLYMRLTASALGVLFLLTIPYHLFMRRNKLLLKISDEAWQAISWRSVAHFVLLSFVAPLLYFTFLTVFTPLTGKDFGLQHTFVFPLFPVISLALLLVLLPRLLVHKFVAPWEKLVSLPTRWHLLLGWIAVFLLLLPLHALLFLVDSHLSDRMTGYALFCWAPTLLWLLCNGGKSVFTRHPYPRAMHSLRRRLVGVCTVCGIIVLALSGWACTWCESYWIKQDKLMAVSPDMPSLSFEAEITHTAHQELRDIFP